MSKKRHETVPKIDASGHMRPLLADNTRRRLIKVSLEMIKSARQEFDVIAYRGASGAVTASIIGHALRKPLILVRKDGDKGHSTLKVEGPEWFRRYLIVDDFMSTGATYEAIRTALKDHCWDAECLGILEVAYALDYEYKMKQGPYRYKISDEHKAEKERESRIATGTATSKDIEWLIGRETARLAKLEKARERAKHDAQQNFLWRQDKDQRKAERKAQEAQAKLPKPEVKLEYVHLPSRPVMIYNDGTTYKFDFEDRKQLLLTDGAPQGLGDQWSAAFLKSMINLLKSCAIPQSLLYREQSLLYREPAGRPTGTPTRWGPMRSQKVSTEEHEHKAKTEAAGSY
jgi:adenine/guanine phosphoribosyltransferase-like PRPP-binding protein